MLATVAEFPLEELREAEVELLDMLERVVIRGKGWHKNDKLRGLRDRIPLIPRMLSQKGKKKSVRTYQRAIRRLEQAGLILCQGTGSDQLRVFSPSWWVVSTPEDALSVWKTASATWMDITVNDSERRPEDVPMAHPCPSSDAPPVDPNPDVTRSHIRLLRGRRCDKPADGN